MPTPMPENRACFKLGDIARITGGNLLGSAEASVEGVCTDSRAPTRGKLFLALSGQRFDGHAFVTAAIRGGARALLVERDVGEVGVPVVRVPSAERALLALGHAQRARCSAKVVAVAGSAGKTTTRSAVAAALCVEEPEAVHFVRGNLNNRIGVPLVLLGLEARHRYAVVEIGTNQPGEVRELTEVVEPNVAILTLIGLEHTQGLGSLDQIEDEEGSLFTSLKSQAVAIGNRDDARVERKLLQASSQTRLGYGFTDRAEYRVLERVPGALGPSRVRLSRPVGGPLAVESPLIGQAGAYAVAAAVAACEVCFGRPLANGELDSAFAGAGLGEPGRLTPIRLGNSLVVLDDTYNSNPASLPSSVNAAAEIARARGARLVLVLGEMRELGDDSPRLHREAGERIADSGARLVLAFTGDARWLLEPFERVGARALFAQDADAVAKLLLSELLEDDVVLVKASRGVRAERVVEELLRAFGESR